MAFLEEYHRRIRYRPVVARKDGTSAKP